MNMSEWILSKATNLFEFRGIQVFGIEAIGAESRVTKATIYK
ncbi:TetR family transcriptional regulator [Methylotenera sp.]